MILRVRYFCIKLNTKQRGYCTSCVYFIRSSSISESLFVDRLSSEANEIRRRTELPRIIVRRTRQLSAQKGSLCPHCALLEKSTTGTTWRMLLSLLRQRVARDLLQMRNLSPIWTVGRPRTDGQISLSVALLSASIQRGRHCPGSHQEWMFWFPWMHRVPFSSAPRAVDRFSSPLEIFVLTTRSPPPFASPLSTIALVFFLGSRPKEKKPLEDESRTSTVSMNYHFARPFRSLVTPNGSIYLALWNDSQETCWWTVSLASRGWKPFVRLSVL